MRYLLDVNVLIALGFQEHEFHGPVAQWIEQQKNSVLLTCSITELGFVRVVAQVPAHGVDVRQAKELLAQLKASRLYQFEFISDGNDAALLPSWVRVPSQTTDGHLVQLAKASGATLATMDKRIPGALLIS